MPSQPVSPATLPAQERQCRSKLHQLLSQAEGFLNGSRSGKPTCRCASDDEAKHRSLYLGQTLNGKTTMLYIPASLEPSVRQWVANFQQAAQLIEQLRDSKCLQRWLGTSKLPSGTKILISSSGQLDLAVVLIRELKTTRPC